MKVFKHVERYHVSSKKCEKEYYVHEDKYSFHKDFYVFSNIYLLS